METETRLSDRRFSDAIEAALELIARTPGYSDTAAELREKWRCGHIHYSPSLADRATTSLLGRVTLGTEAIAGSFLGLAETLVHEHHHVHQNPFLKTVSFWAGIATGTPIMCRYERPAYRAALRFLIAAEELPGFAEFAESEQRAVRATFAGCYGEPLEL